MRLTAQAARTMARAQTRRTSATRHAVSACSLRPANVIPLVVPLARFSAWMARIQADGIAEEETNGSAISRRPRAPRQSPRSGSPRNRARDPGPHEIGPPRSGSPRNRASDLVGWLVGWSSRVELPPRRRRRVTHLASGRRSRHSPEIVDRFTPSAIGNRWAL